MAHQCVHCGEVYPDAAPELLKGCKCGARFFYYIKQEKVEEAEKEMQNTLFELSKAEKIQIEKDIREITGMHEEPDRPVILNVESIRVITPGKYEIDIVNLFSKKRPLIYRFGEGKYVIDLSDTITASKAEIDKKIRDPRTIMEEEDKDEEEEEKEEFLDKDEEN